MTDATPNLPNKYLATLYEITRKLNSSLALNEVLDYVMDCVIQVTGAERGFLMLRNDKTGEFEFRVARAIHQQDLDTPEFQISRTVTKHVARTEKPLLTRDAQVELEGMESVMLQALRSIICVPIHVREDLLGLVYVDNRYQVGRFRTQHLDLVTAFASQAGVAIENARLYEIAVEQGRVQRELEMAHSIQRELLPTDFPVLDGYEVAVHWESAYEVAGDFYDCFITADSAAMGVVVADVSGKGVPAALFMAVARSLIRASAFATDSPEAALRQANQLILKDAGSSGMFVTAYHAMFSADGRMLCVNAGHNEPLLWRASTGDLEWLPRGGRALGWFEELPIQTHQYQLEVGDMVVFYTDGLTEAENATQTPYGNEQLEQVIRFAAKRSNAATLKKFILQSVKNHVGDIPPFDDHTLVIVRYSG